jgi:uncharacterized protein YqjF (DUF2071 family)
MMRDGLPSPTPAPASAVATASPTDGERLRARDRPADSPIMRQTWRHLGFLHWPVDADSIARALPPGLHVDTFEGVAYVGIVPFTIPHSRTARFGVPIAPAFHELNLRTYVHRNGRDPGVWFFSLDAASRLAVAGARAAYHLPYFHAQMSMHASHTSGEPPVDVRIAYESRRLGNRASAEFHGRYGPIGPATPASVGTLEFFLIERYLLYAWNGRSLKAARVHHAAYPVQAASADDVVETLTEAAGLARGAGLAAPGGPPPLVHYAREVDVRIYLPHLVASRAIG